MSTYLEELQRQRRRKWAWAGGVLSLCAVIYATAAVQYFETSRKQALTAASADRLLQSAQANPNDAELVYTAAYKLWMAGRTREALPLAERARSLAAERAVHQLLVGFLYAADHRPAEALRQYETAVRLEKGLYQAHTAAGQCYLRVRMPAEAVEHLRLAWNPARPDAATMGSLVEALTQAGHYEEAEAKCRELMRYLPPHDIRGFVLLERILKPQNRGAAVEKEMIAYWQTQPQMMRGDFYAKLTRMILDSDATDRRLKEAELWALRGVGCRPATGEAHEALAEVRARQRRYPEALEQLQKATSIQPLSARAEGVRAKVSSALDRSKATGEAHAPRTHAPSKAELAQLRKRYQENPRNSEACLAFATALEHAGDPAAAFRLCWPLVREAGAEPGLLTAANRMLEAALTRPVEE